MLTNTQRQKAVPARDVELKSGFWADRQALNRARTLPAIHHQLKLSGRLDAWRLQWEDGDPKKPSTKAIPDRFWDSDVGKWIEAVSYSLVNYPNPEFEQEVDEVADLIEQAQQPDGYLNIYFTGIEPHNQWRNLRDWHEMYNAGHLIEAAVAYYQATGKRKLLDVLSRYANLIDSKFGPDEGKKRGYPGHPELELALIKLYHATGEQRYLKLAKYFVDERGQLPHYFDIEARERGEDPREFWAKTYHYCQAHAPLREQTEATGHSVRAGYLYSGAADIVAETGDTALLNALRSIWEDLVHHSMYITGGLGPAHANEGFTFAYDLPNETAYAETCASIALVFWAHRMFHLDPDSRYIDVMERALYNGVLSGVSLEGDTFFYANPLASFPKVSPFERWSGITTDRFYRRSEWFGCPCCPPNLARLVANIGEYFYSTTDDTLFVHLYSQNRSSVQLGAGVVEIAQETNYPWDGTIAFSLGVAQPTSFELALRIPGWCHEFHLELNDSPVSAEVVGGYARLHRTWENGDRVTLTLAMPVERMVPHPHIRQDAGQVALQRGPVVYCLEEVDNGARLANVVVPADAALSAHFDPDLFGGVSVITGAAQRIEPQEWQGALYQPHGDVQISQTSVTLTAIPYCFWANRSPGEMRVWIRET
ncbi:MAG: glycoside hydrolase family 127 protein [Anaerolineae bacterium]